MLRSLAAGFRPKWRSAAARRWPCTRVSHCRARSYTRHVSELHDIDLVSAPHPTIDGVDTLRLAAGQASAALASAVVGMKWDLTRTLVIGGHLTWALTNGGLTAPLTPTLAFEYAF